MTNVHNTVLFHYFACQNRDVTVDVGPIPCQGGNRVIRDLDSKEDGIILVEYYRNDKIKPVVFKLSDRTELNRISF